MSHPFEVLAGEWQGRGNGSYPTIADFSYSEHLAIEPVPGKPLARWTSKTRDAATGDARHAESGFLRATPSGVEFVVAHAFGVVEVATGSIDDASLLLSSDDLHGAPTAKQIDRVELRQRPLPLAARRVHHRWDALGGRGLARGAGRRHLRTVHARTHPRRRGIHPLLEGSTASGCGPSVLRARDRSGAARDRSRPAARRSPRRKSARVRRRVPSHLRPSEPRRGHPCPSVRPVRGDRQCPAPALRKRRSSASS